jgi:hypothetical protein
MAKRQADLTSPWLFLYCRPRCMEPPPEFIDVVTLRDIDSRELSVCTPAPDRLLSAGSFREASGAVDAGGHGARSENALRLIAAGRAADDDFGDDLSCLTPPKWWRSCRPIPTWHSLSISSERPWDRGARHDQHWCRLHRVA